MTAAMQEAQAALDAERKHFESGDRMALLAAIRKCAAHDLPLPSWAATAYIAAFDEVLNCRVASWDAAFGRPYPKGANLTAMRKRRHLRFAVWNEVQTILMGDPKASIDAALFARVGQRFHIGKTLAESCYYTAAKLLGPAQRPRG